MPECNASRYSPGTRYDTQTCKRARHRFGRASSELGCYPWAEWVPSKLNIADWASRPDKHHMLPRTAERVPMVLPYVADFLDVPE